MELISRQAVLDGIDKYIEKAQSTGTKDDFISFEELVVKALPSAFEGMTNGEVIQALFPNSEVVFTLFNVPKRDVIKIDNEAFLVERSWWDSPYKGVSE